VNVFLETAVTFSNFVVLFTVYFYNTFFNLVSMLIINPSYDAAFKCLLENNKLAKFFIELRLETTILELEIQPQEIPIKIAKEENPFSVLRLDFKATIIDEKGERKAVLIELQSDSINKGLEIFYLTSNIMFICQQECEQE